MSDFLSEALSADEAVEVDVTIRGKTGKALVKRLSAIQREQLLDGQIIETKPGEKGTIKFDLGANQLNKRKTVLFSYMNGDGKPRFKNLAEVGNLEEDKLEALYDAYSNAFKEAEEVGKT